MKIEKDINKELLAMKKKDEIDEALYSRLRSTGGQPARLYGLAKVHKKGTPLRPVLSLPGSSYEHLNKTLAKFFDNIEGANIETNTQMAREIIENIDLDYNESIISLDVKSLYTNVPLKEAIDIALRKLYEQTIPPKLARGTMKKLLNMAVSKVHFKCNGLWYVQKDGLAMGASLAVILANLWLKEYEYALMKEVPALTQLNENRNGLCPDCERRVTYRSKGIECEACLNWYHLKCSNVSDKEYEQISEMVWYCKRCKEQRDQEKRTENVKAFLRYVDDIVRTVKGDPDIVLKAANELHPNLQFTIENPDSNGDLAFLDLKINVDSRKKVTCGWYQKPTDTGTILKFRSCAPLQYKRNVVEGTVHRIFRSTSTWENFDKAMKINKEQWVDNQYPEKWSDGVVLRTLNKIIDRKTDTRTTVTSVKEDPLKVSAPIITLQYRGNASEWFAAKLRQNAGAQVIFTTRKLKTCLPSLKSPFAKDLKSRVVYKLTCSGCNSTYVGQTVRHLTTRIEEHHKEDSPVGQHLRECDRDGKSAELRSEIIDQSSNIQKLLTLEALHIWKERPRINTREEFRSRELTLKL